MKAEGNQAWVGIICDFLDGDDSDDESDNGKEGGSTKMAKFMWFSSEKEIRNKSTKRTDNLPVCLQPP